MKNPDHFNILKFIVNKPGSSKTAVFEFNVLANNYLRELRKKLIKM